MLAEISPQVYSAGFALIFALIGFMVAKGFYSYREEKIVEQTILYLVKNKFVRSRMVEGQIELLQLPTELPAEE